MGDGQTLVMPAAVFETRVERLLSLMRACHVATRRVAIVQQTGFQHLTCHGTTLIVTAAVLDASSESLFGLMGTLIAAVRRSAVFLETVFAHVMGMGHALIVAHDQNA